VEGGGKYLVDVDEHIVYMMMMMMMMMLDHRDATLLERVTKLSPVLSVGVALAVAR